MGYLAFQTRRGPGRGCVFRLSNAHGRRVPILQLWSNVIQPSLISNHLWCTFFLLLLHFLCIQYCILYVLFPLFCDFSLYSRRWWIIMEEQGDLNCNKITIQSSSEVYVHRFTTVFSCTSTQSSLSWQGPPIYISLDVDNVLLQSDLDGACDGICCESDWTIFLP